MLTNLVRLMPLLCVAFLTSPAQADKFLLKSGGSLEGKLLNADESPRRSYRIQLATGGDLTLATNDVRKVEKLSLRQQQYKAALNSMADTVDAHMKMYELCKKHSLTRERQFHLEQVIRIDPKHERARSLLRYRQKPDGTWGKLEEIKKSAGLVKWKGKWITEKEAKYAELAEQRKQQQIEWKKKIKRWRGWLSDGSRQNKAIAAFNSIDDPLAVAPLVELFWDDKNPRLRELLAELFGRIGTPAAAQALAGAAKLGGTPDADDLRVMSVRILKRNKLHGVAPSFLSELRSASNARVRRAGYAIGELGDESMLLPLIKAVRTKHIVEVGGRGNGRINAGNGQFSLGRTKPKKVPVWRDNKEVRDALGKLSDAPDFGYNQGKWLEWYARKNTPPSLDLRRDL